MDVQQTLSRKGIIEMNPAITYILLSVILGAVGQILLKRGMSTMGPLSISLDSLVGLLVRIATNPYVVTGLLIYVGGTLFWLVALSRVELSFAYPFASLSYVIMLVASWGLFHENISLLRLVGTLVIGLGVLLISRS